MVSRRNWIKGTGAFVVGATAVGTSLGGSQPAAATTSEAQATASSATSASDPTVSALFAPVSPGQQVGHGWAFVGATSVQDGAASIVLAHEDGDRAVVALHARDGRAVGLTSTDRFDLVLINDSTGGRVTDERLGQVILSLGALVAANESDEALALGFESHRAYTRRRETEQLA